ncbi:MAG: NB-ARC domain-containing protein [Thermoplasmata archaeon]
MTHPEVLADDWLPPVPLGRQHEVDEVVRRLDPPVPRAPPPWVVGVCGPSGSGTSVVARRAAREVADRIRAGISASSPRILWVRVSTTRGAHGVATALLRRLDDGFDGRGFPAVEILAGFLRRIRREGRPTVLVLDDIGVSATDLVPALRALGAPDRFLPEGESGLPAVFTIVAGRPEALDRLDAALAGQFPFAPFIPLAPYSDRVLTAIVQDRAERALGRPVAPERVASIVARAVEEGGGARQAVVLLRRSLLGSSFGPYPPFSIASGHSGVSIEPRVVRAIGVATGGVAAHLGEVRRLEAELARSQGLRPLPTTTLWRRIVRLEAAGYVRREIRAGGNGGTQSLVRVLTPIEEWVTAPRQTGILRGSGPTDGFGFGLAGDPPERFRPGTELLPYDGAID